MYFLKESRKSNTQENKKPEIKLQGISNFKNALGNFMVKKVQQNIKKNEITEVSEKEKVIRRRVTMLGQSIDEDKEQAFDSTKVYPEQFKNIIKEGVMKKGMDQKSMNSTNYTDGTQEESWVNEPTKTSLNSKILGFFKVCPYEEGQVFEEEEMFTSVKV